MNLTRIYFRLGIIASEQWNVLTRFTIRDSYQWLYLHTSIVAPHQKKKCLIRNLGVSGDKICQNSEFSIYTTPCNTSISIIIGDNCQRLYFHLTSLPQYRRMTSKFRSLLRLCIFTIPLVK